MNHLAPEILCQLINKLKSRIRTRGAKSGNCRTAKRNTTFGQSSFVAIGTKLWNTLPSEIKTLTELKVFNTQVKQWLKLNKPCEHWHARTWARAHALIIVLVFYVSCIWRLLYFYSCVTFSKGLTRDRGCKLVLTRNLYVWHLFYILYETMYNVFVPAQ